MARFIPGGRTVVTLTAGMTSMNRAKFVVATIVAGLLWATYAACLGYFGGKAFEDNHTLAFVVAFAAALAVSGLTELVRWLLRRRKERVGRRRNDVDLARPWPADHAGRPPLAPESTPWPRRWRRSRPGPAVTATAAGPPAAALVAPTTAPRRAGPRWPPLLLVVAVGLAFADASVVALALPDLYGEFDTTIVGVSWVLTTYALVVAVVAVPVALLHRRVRPAVLAGAGLGAVRRRLAGRRARRRACRSCSPPAPSRASAPRCCWPARSRCSAPASGRWSRARRWWSAAAGVGAVAGPALGGVLTQLLRLAGHLPRAGAGRRRRPPGLPRPPPPAPSRPTASRRASPVGPALLAAVPANIGFVLVFAGLVGALFLGVLLAIEVWRYPPDHGAPSS